MIGRLQRLPLRDVWPHEAHDFTTWMEENVDALDEALGLGLASAVREQSTGVFSVDLLCETADGDRIVVENQLAPSDHKHLGQLITYLAAFDAAAAVWVTSDARPEHVQAIAWLNESTAAAFYLVKVEAVQIGDSSPAPVFTLIVGPSIEARQIGERKQELSDQQRLFQRFWPGVIELDPESLREPPRNYWMSGGSACHPKTTFFYCALKNRSRVELYMDADGPRNEALFRALQAHTDEIGAVFGDELDWDYDEARRAQRVAFHLPVGWGEGEDAWPALQQDLVETMHRFRSALRPFLDRVSAAP